MIALAFLVLTALVLGEACVIWALINRLLIQAKLPPVLWPLAEEKPAEPPLPKPVPLFSVPFQG